MTEFGFLIRQKASGDHVHLSVFVRDNPQATYAHAGRLVMRLPEARWFRRVLMYSTAGITVKIEDESPLTGRLTDLVEDGKLTADDAAAIEEFAAFLTDPEVRKPGERLALSVLRQHQHVIGLTDEELAEVERRRAAE